MITMIRTQISVDGGLYRKAKEAARLQGISLAELCRRSLASAVSRVRGKRPWMSFAGIINGRPDDSTTVDDVVYGRDKP